MFFSLLVVLIQSQIKICVCHKRCSSLCHNDFINTYYNPTFKDFLLHYLDKNNELELNFYSEEDNFSFEINLSNFVNNKIILKNFIDSKPVNVIIMNGNSLVEKILINPNNQILFPKLKSNILSQTQNNVIYNDALVPKDTSKSNTQEYDDLEGLINVTCDKFNYYKSYSKCINGPYARGGSYLNSGGLINYTFNGTKIYVVAHANEESAEVDISIDGKFVCKASHNSNFNHYPIVLSSDIYPFGEHTITIEHKGTSRAFFVNSLLVDPLPKVGGHKLGFYDIHNNTGWELNNSLKTPFFRSATNASFIFKFYGTRFWLTGIRDNNYGECNLIIDDGEPIKIDGRIGIDNFVDTAKDSYGNTVQVKVRANGNQGVLLYESDVLDFKDHTIKIEKLDNKEFRIINLLYTTQPYNAIVVPSNEITFDGNWIEEAGGYSTNSDGSRGKITEYLNHFWIIGNKTMNDQALMNIYYNEEKVININVSKIDTIFSNEILFRSLKSISRDTYSIEIEKTSYPPGSTTDFLHISYLYYLNEKTINVHKDATIKNVQDNDVDKENGWNEENEKFFSETKGSSITFNSIPFVQFWITGDVDPNYGVIEIYIDDKFESSVSLYNEKHVENVVFYESPMIKIITNHKITLKNQDGKKVSILRIQYVGYSGYNKEYDDLDGLINITCDLFNNKGDYGSCRASAGASGGSFYRNNGNLSYTFNGTRIYVVSHEGGDQGGEMQISIDGKVVATARPNKNDGSYPVIFSSDYYPFGEHTIIIKCISNDMKTYYINSLLVDPLPKVGGHKLGFYDIQNNTGWELNNSLKTPFFRSATNASFIFKFHGTRFWLTGIRDNNYGECNLIIDDGEPIKIDGRIGIDNFVESAFDGRKTIKIRVRANGNQGVLLYESDVLDFKDHTIKIEKLDNKEFRIINLLYTTQPYNAIVVPSNEITFDGNWIEEAGGYSTNSDGSRGKITEYLNHFWIIGNKTMNDQALMNIYYNEEKVININVSKIDTIFSNEILFRSLKSISRDTYSIEIEKTSYPPGSTTDFLHISYLYYLNEKTINVDDDSHKISINEMENNKNGTWNHDDDNMFTEEKDASISIEFFGNKFWIYGTVDPNYGIIDIIFDGEKQSHVSLYNEKHIKNIVLYESPEANSQDVHSLKLINQKKSRISIYQIVYQVLPSTESFSLSNDFTESKDFSNSDMFTRTGAFSRTIDFTRTDEFSGTLHFTETNKFSGTGDFTKSSFFSVSEHFTESSKFSRTNDFTSSDKFSRSSFFSGTEYFTETSRFSKTSDFTRTDEFTRSSFFSDTDHFTGTNKFSQTNDFTRTAYFSSSFYFSGSDKFLSSSYFSGSGYFSETEKFSRSSFFSVSSYFSESGKFSRSKEFVRTEYFSKSDNFSKSGYFSETGKFSLSSFFSSSEYFIETAKFSLTDEFTRTVHFSKSGSFSETGKFSLTNDFTHSFFFSSSFYFSETAKFSLSDEFTRTEYFSNSFSESDKFSQTSFFSKTALFTMTVHFTQSSDFSKSSMFSKSLGFSGTQGFSQSIAFSPSLPLENGDYCLYESQEKNYTTGDCNFTIKNQNDVIIRIILTNFTDYIEMYDGGAVYINNAGLDCTSISFTHCISTKGGGGAIYIKNTPDLLHNVTIDDTLIKRCQAQYGGGCYIYSQSEENEVFITRSNFSENVAILKKKTDESKNFFGGSHLFITAKNVKVKFSIFEKGVKNGVKVYNVFDQIVGGAKKLDEAPNHIFIFGCNFDHEGDSSSINFIDTKSDSKIELVECGFAGKITENSHYIDGKVASKDADSIKLISCNFEYKNKMAVRIDTLNEDDLLEIKENQKNASLSSLSGLSSLGILVIILSIALIIITLISLVILLSKGQFELDDTINES